MPFFPHAKCDFEKADPVDQQPKEPTASMPKDSPGWQAFRLEYATYALGDDFLDDTEIISDVEEGYSASCPIKNEDVTSALATQVGGGHYKDLAIQPIEYITRNNLGWHEGNIVKYITRHAIKGGAEDIDKVIHYANLLKEFKYGKQ